MSYNISGIQQVGVGIPNVHEAFKWYRHHFGMDIPVFEEAATADLMLPYTGGKSHERHAILAINLQGGGGFEIWQYTSRTPQAPKFEPKLGDYGIFITKIKCFDAKAVYDYFLEKHLNVIGLLSQDPAGKNTFYVSDPYGNYFQLVESKDWFQNLKQPTGGPYGAVIGVSNIEKSKKFYGQILGYDEVVYDEQQQFDDYKAMPGGGQLFRRVLLRHSKAREGAFSRMLGSSEIELVQMPGPAKKIYKNRFWGDLGFIHLCFDINGMDALEQRCNSLGHPFTVDSKNSFDMGEAAGRFSYIEDPDGTLIEFVETHKLPILKKIGWYKNLKKRNPLKPLPDWMLKTLKFNRVKD